MRGPVPPGQLRRRQSLVLHRRLQHSVWALRAHFPPPPRTAAAAAPACGGPASCIRRTDRRIGTTGHEKGQACARGEPTYGLLLGAAEGQVARPGCTGVCGEHDLHALVLAALTHAGGHVPQVDQGPHAGPSRMGRSMHSARVFDLRADSPRKLRCCGRQWPGEGRPVRAAWARDSADGGRSGNSPPRWQRVAARVKRP